MPGLKEIEDAVAMAEAETGVRGGKSRLRLQVKPPKRTRHWSKEDLQFVTDQLGRLTEKEIAIRLGRSESAVHIQRERTLHLVAPSKSPKILTAEHVAMGIGVDGHSVHRLLNRGLLAGRKLPFDKGRVIWVVDRLVFMRWMLDSNHWCYFKPKWVGTLRFRGRRGYTQVYDSNFWKGARKAVLATASKWKDKWLKPSQAARRLGCHRHNINAGIHAGNLKGTRWGNWWILKSDLPAGQTINAKGRLVPFGSIQKRPRK